ncbi:Lar family restriction alleviation protein [Pseudomonas sichuanensis]|uniref:Lar family restriction alleviation protein n=1 Tax=Pseudomonas sichuanensis TaxID=2213015 RepID=UPI001300AE17|nr:Lar family restriction alleviation protein [Pseudomonas sichuanensis]
MPTENRPSNTEMVSELLPCPFCGQQDFLIERLDSDASVVICQGLTGPHEACLARGPVGVAQDEGEEQPGRDKAVELWNARAERRQGESVALPSRKSEPTEDSDVFTDAENSGFNACLDEIAKLGPLYAHAHTCEKCSGVHCSKTVCVLEIAAERDTLRAQLADLKRRHDGLRRDMATIAGREVPKGCTVADYAAAAIADALSASAAPKAKS